MKRCLSFILSAVLVLSLCSVAYAEDYEISVVIGNTSVVWTDAKPFIDNNNRTMVPLRAVGEALGLFVDWDSVTREAVFSNGDIEIRFPIDSTIAKTSDGKNIVMDTAAVIVEGRTYAPIRYLAEFFGYMVEWDAITRSVIISSTQNNTGSLESTFERMVSLITKKSLLHSNDYVYVFYHHDEIFTAVYYQPDKNCIRFEYSDFNFGNSGNQTDIIDLVIDTNMTTPYYGTHTHTVDSSTFVSQYYVSPENYSREMTVTISETDMSASMSQLETMVSVSFDNMLESIEHDFLRPNGFSLSDLNFLSFLSIVTQDEDSYTNPTIGQKNAVDKAVQYLSVLPFSYSGLVSQLEYEGFTHLESVYGADNCGADWYEQAALKAASYLKIMAFSRQGLIEQLEYEGFTHDQAVYGVEQNGF